MAVKAYQDSHTISYICAECNMLSWPVVKLFVDLGSGFTPELASACCGKDILIKSNCGLIERLDDGKM